MIVEDFSQARLDEHLARTQGASARDADWQEDHFLRNAIFRSDYDEDIWLLAVDAWMIAQRDGVVRWPVSTDEMLGHVAGSKPGRRIVLSVHPEYVAG